MKDEKNVLAGYVKTGVGMVGAGVVTYICASPRMQKKYRLELKQFRKEIAIALGLRKYTPELKQEFKINEQITDLIESIDKDCCYKRAINLYLIASIGHKEDSVRQEAKDMLVKVNESITRKKNKLKDFMAIYKTQEALANQVQAEINQKRKQK